MRLFGLSRRSEFHSPEHLFHAIAYRKAATIVDLQAGRRARERPVSNSFNPEVNADPGTGLFITP
jgi:hypothetical protein